MKLADVKKELHEVLYIEDDGMIDILLATVIANSIAESDPVWLMVVGASSGGKSQLLRPFATGNPEFIHRIDDMTENSLISGTKTEEVSLLAKIKEKGILLISDFTVIFSKSPETKNAILGQLRLVYDGEYTRHFGNREPYTWKGHLGLIAGATPSIYRRMEEVADMGERFIYYRMKEYDAEKAMDFVKKNTLSSKEIDEKIATIYKDYVTSIMVGRTEVEVDESTNNILAEVTPLVTQLRTPVHIDQRWGYVDEIPIREVPFRVFKQLKTIAKSLTLMQYHEDGSRVLSDDKVKALKWCAYSLGNEERRKTLEAVVGCDCTISAHDIAVYLGFETTIADRYISQLTAIGVLTMIGSKESNGEKYKVTNGNFTKFVRELDEQVKVEEEDREFVSKF